MKGLIGISLGDISGVGPEVALKALAAIVEQGIGSNRFVLIGDASLTRSLARQLGLNFSLPNYPDNNQPISILDNKLVTLPPKVVAAAPEAARAAVAWLKTGAELCLKGELDALVTAPVNKESIVRSGQPFVGQTEYLSELAEAERTAMMLLGHDEQGRWLRVALATTHVPLKLVSENLSGVKIKTAIELAAQACRDLGLPRSRVAVCGLNPHAGEGGLMGTEEQTVIGPAVQECKNKGIDVVGPFSADTLFFQAFRGDFDAVVSMYHDQGLVPLKMIGFDSGVNWTLGLPFIRTSPDHGTAYDIAGQGKANSSSMKAAIRLAMQLASNK